MAKDAALPARGFSDDEFRARTALAQERMRAAGIDALLLTTEPEVRYFTGFLTRFWESPTRPWFLVVPARGDPVAVIPSIGAALMRQSRLSDIRCWRSPDYADDGVSLLAAALAERVPASGTIGVPDGAETHLRMPLSSWAALKDRLPDRRFAGDAGILRQLRMVKSPAEIARIAAACAVAGRAFARVREIARPGVPLSEVFRRFQMLCLDEGADWVPYLAGGAAPGGYGDVISPATDRPLARGDVLMLDTGLVLDGYFCDFDRNFSIGAPAPEVAQAHDRLLDATRAAFDAARPGATAAELFHVMDRICTGGAGGSDAGRLGHGLGMQLTEPPSLIPADATELRPGMVLTLEPGISLSSGRILVHEEDIVIRDGGADWLSPPATALEVLT
ncbi:M24 family metallopeptidase [Salipiger sp.]|uniref:M24 family metallopeptidase n=1 Tax=Salipiger sp. TaxID=2078585 RepID=UPI003A982EE7